MMRSSRFVRRKLFAPLLFVLVMVSPLVTFGQGMMGRPVMGEEAVAIGSDGTVYVVASPTQMGMGHEFGRVTLVALDPATLRPKWRYALGDEDLIASRPVVGPDGTVYVTVSEMFEMRDFDSSADRPESVRNARVVAVRDGALKWEYELDVPFASAPALGPDGRQVFVTASEWGLPEMPGVRMFGRSWLLALTDRGGSVAVAARLDLGTGSASAPVVGPHPASSWAVFVTVEAGMMGGMGMRGGTTLFIVSPDLRVTSVRVR